MASAREVLVGIPPTIPRKAESTNLVFSAWRVDWTWFWVSGSRSSKWPPAAPFRFRSASPTNMIHPALSLLGRAAASLVLRAFCLKPGIAFLMTHASRAPFFSLMPFSFSARPQPKLCNEPAAGPQNLKVHRRPPPRRGQGADTARKVCASVWRIQTE